jgi:hypothetical protein
MGPPAGRRSARSAVATGTALVSGAVPVEMRRYSPRASPLAVASHDLFAVVVLILSFFYPEVTRLQIVSTIRIGILNKIT